MSLKILATAGIADRHTADLEAIVCHNGQVITGGDDGKIKIWTPDLKHVQEIAANDICVLHIASGNESVYSCSTDGNIYEWACKGKEWVLKYTYPTSGPSIQKLVFTDGVLYAADEYGGVSVYEGTALKRIHVIVEEIWDLVVHGDDLITAGGNDVTVAKISKDSDKYVVNAVVSGRGPICVNADTLFSTTVDGKSISVRKRQAGCEEIGVLKGHELIIKAMCCDQKHLYTSGYDKIIKQWDIKSLKLVKEIVVDGYINSLYIGSSDKLFAGGADGILYTIGI